MKFIFESAAISIGIVVLGISLFNNLYQASILAWQSYWLLFAMILSIFSATGAYFFNKRLRIL